MMRDNNKGFVVGTIIGVAALIVVILVISLVSLVLFNFNQEIQGNVAINAEGKQAAADAQATFPPLLGYGFLALFIGFFLYTIITAILINNIHPIFWIVGFILTLIATIMFSVIKYIFDALSEVSELSGYIAAIPGAAWLLSNIEIIGPVWLGLQLTIIYITWDR